MNFNVKIRVTFTVIFLSICLLHTRYSCAQRFTKEEIKLAYLHNFIKFIEWPQGKKVLKLGIIGQNQFTTILKSKLSQQTVGDRKLDIVYFSAHQDYTKCDILYLAKGAEVSSKAVLNKIADKQILSVSEVENFCLNGGIIQLIEGDRSNYFFEINQQKALKEKIRISSKLLKLAIKIR